MAHVSFNKYKYKYKHKIINYKLKLKIQIKKQTKKKKKKKLAELLRMVLSPLGRPEGVAKPPLQGH
jgi:hypothetical protein